LFRGEDDFVPLYTDNAGAALAWGELRISRRTFEASPDGGKNISAGMDETA
jgi:hypothetical protein